MSLLRRPIIICVLLTFVFSDVYGQDQLEQPQKSVSVPVGAEFFYTYYAQEQAIDTGLRAYVRVYPGPVGFYGSLSSPVFRDNASVKQVYSAGFSIRLHDSDQYYVAVDVTPALVVRDSELYRAERLRFTVGPYRRGFQAAIEVNTFLLQTDTGAAGYTVSFGWNL